VTRATLEQLRREHGTVSLLHELAGIERDAAVRCKDRLELLEAADHRTIANLLREAAALIGELPSLGGDPDPAYYVELRQGLV
jgi:hypothetical protein